MGFANSFVHVLMYGYYALTALGYRGGCYSFIKRNLTRIQMLQFILMFAHSTQVLFNGCDFPHWIAYFNSSLAVLFLVLFIDFYRSKYREKESTAMRSTTWGKSSLQRFTAKKNNFTVLIFLLFIVSNDAFSTVNIIHIHRGTERRDTFVFTRLHQDNW